VVAERTFKMNRWLALAVHTIIWLYIFLSPLLFSRSGELTTFPAIMRRLIFPIGDCVLFYLNYSLLVPRLLVRGRWKQFLAINVVVIIVIFVLREAALQWLMSAERQNAMPMMPGPERWKMYTRGFISLIFVVLIAVAIRLSLRWQENEEARRKAELGRAEAELQNIKSQINPHFLLNTLNNIYALTAIDSNQAQKAISELSRLLQYVLYESQARYIPLSQAVAFLKSYIHLMQIRLPSNVTVDVDLPDDADDTEIAPLIFLPLVENAFKHGVHPTEPSFIRVQLTRSDDSICMSVRNSNFPKDENEKIPGGIGLRQVAERLKLLYPDRYTWSEGASEDGKEYHSILKLSL